MLIGECVNQSSRRFQLPDVSRRFCSEVQCSLRLAGLKALNSRQRVRRPLSKLTEALAKALHRNNPERAAMSVLSPPIVPKFSGIETNRSLTPV